MLDKDICMKCRQKEANKKEREESNKNNNFNEIYSKYPLYISWDSKDEKLWDIGIVICSAALKNGLKYSADGKIGIIVKPQACCYYKLEQLIAEQKNIQGVKFL
jgi:hypothetical protein